MYDVRLFEYIVDPSRKKKPTLLSKDVKTFYIYSKEDGILAGNQVLDSFFEFYDLDIEFRIHKEDGSSFKRGEILASIIGRASDVYFVLDEVTKLLARLSGIATIANYYQSKLGATRLLDLGDYTPLYESFEQETLRLTGVKKLENLYVINELEIDDAGGILEAVEKAKYIYPTETIALEITDIKLFYDAINTKADILILKHFNDEALRRAKLDAPSEKILVIGGTVLPQRLEYISKLSFSYLSTPFLINASRILEFDVKLGK